MNHWIGCMVLASLVGCGKGDSKNEGGGGGSCPAFAVTVDGAAVPGLTHGHAVTMESAGNKLCVPKPIEFSPTIGAYKGKKVSIVGKAVGPYCGVNKI